MNGCSTRRGEQEEGEFLAGLAGACVAQFGSAGDDLPVLAVVAPAFGGEPGEVHGVTGGFVTAESGWQPPFAEEV